MSAQKVVKLGAAVNHDDDDDDDDTDDNCWLMTANSPDRPIGSNEPKAKTILEHLKKYFEQFQSEVLTEDSVKVFEYIYIANIYIYYKYIL